ncbi:hypothetical protein E3N88_26453 [Mikania micrantha]|uniref:Uncharacterized protein n=1 Tax=Mikania micrantha TaxID=192012 RepID=A0A5N6N7Q2_9ASTR|nr:hypothetical protein E3N88_26453 [Mikania micrantha]
MSWRRLYLGKSAKFRFLNNPNLPSYETFTTPNHRPQFTPNLPTPPLPTPITNPTTPATFQPNPPPTPSSTTFDISTTSTPSPTQITSPTPSTASSSATEPTSQNESSSSNMSSPPNNVPTRPQRTRTLNTKYFNSNMVNTITVHPIPATLEPTSHTQTLKDPEWRTQWITNLMHFCKTKRGNPPTSNKPIGPMAPLSDTKHT